MVSCYFARNQKGDVFEMSLIDRLQREIANHDPSDESKLQDFVDGCENAYWNALENEVMSSPKTKNIRLNKGVFERVL